MKVCRQSPSLSIFCLGMLCVAVLASGGCGAGRRPRAGEIDIVGRVTKGAAALPVDPNLVQSGAGYVQVSFFQLVDGGGFGGSQSVIASPEGTFKAVLPGPGRYRVAVEHYNGGSDDLLRGRFASQNSPIELEIAENQPEIAIELDDYAKKSQRK